MKYMGLHVWFLLLSMFLMLIHVIVCITNLLLFTAKQYSIVRIYTLCLFIHQLIYICTVSTLRLLWIIPLYTFKLKSLCGHMFSLSWTGIPRSGIAGSHGNSTFHSLRTCQTVFHNAAQFYIPTSNAHGFQFSLHPRQHLVSVFFFFFFNFHRPRR